MDDKQKPARKKSPLAIGGFLAVLLSQGKLLVAALKFGKVGGAVISMFITIWAYAYLAPLPFAIGIVVMILIHELGHVLAAKMKGLPVSAPVFIPFLGALITMKKNPTDAVTEAFIGIGGPILGTVGGVAAFGLGVYLDSGVIVSVAYAAFYLNLFNLLPIHPLDGGRISTAVTRWLWLLGLIGGLIVIVYIDSYFSSKVIFFIIWAMFAWDLYKKYVRYRHKEERVTVATRFEFPANHLLQQSYMIPGENHTRDLDYRTYSELQGTGAGRQTLVMEWQGIGFEGQAYLPVQALVRKVQLVKVDRLEKEDGFYLGLHVQVEYTPLGIQEHYYDVPARTRWKFGAAYVALILFLLYMIRLVHGVGILS
ncbi:site-2 protease family protein [Paenibacillus roseipurpureus]|uniref:Site-2 protease family protein n=1 Tax=Paenibacillus roseopurpureus TaxID=2918901 RepID=A0AA96LRV0_9BACL|nr:site-2 protease family protein [Paenibacillus sp. MBLB1832]WNR43585.1 site-2 protease family protein [Paenibacillus sp. MBLB1832]